jgi:hypothetical protein
MKVPRHSPEIAPLIDSLWGGRIAVNPLEPLSDRIGQGILLNESSQGLTRGQLVQSGVGFSTRAGQVADCQFKGDGKLLKNSVVYRLRRIEALVL